MATRREFLKGAGVLTLGSLVAPGMSVDALAAKPKKPVVEPKEIGLQTYSLGPELRGDKLATGLAKLKEIGVTQLELAGYGKGKVGGVSMADYKKMCDDAGLKIMSSHLNPDCLERNERYCKNNIEAIKDFWKRAADDHAVLGCPYIVQPGLPHIENISDAQFVGEVFNAAGEICAAKGMKFGYHNHNTEFDKVDRQGRTSFAVRSFGPANKDQKFIEEVFIESTDPSKVLIELDVYWTVMGGQDPVEWIQKYGNRIQLLHIKDRLVLGASGMMNFENIFNAHYANGNKTFFIEIEDTNSGKQMERVEASAKFLINAPFVK